MENHFQTYNYITMSYIFIESSAEKSIHSIVIYHSCKGNTDNSSIISVRNSLQSNGGPIGPLGSEVQ